ncbi:MAG: hypothetical protein CO158_09080 [Piscirickettsiaceae bacterium CG_4_9_14_3_um_filter_43_564]|nr:hypothetical protein [Thiomicrospira sp.]OIP96451.1 MAG: hypothetical protein AUK56_01985 [Thiomicrospira sp. CG2_30_44_34]PIQ02638.1 MAG: hypothetical protein COW74_10500 [Piscirickettsiaceae bacterium CG18_big_fil_WC_8_21_14_2_50_44_103]PIU38626.1 MAG: hypothetical protein COT01_05595 [Piscirickettsiaceae bacterium CG07_land_8_20_14_0_80_44_28]PIW57536.1 MAG: hypothetical protein COW14_05480 [Piscirickettsiaceae bacterium CG12_big_fil_rev_8_21_14_0_65_44_934]PIW77529.1 MAG: hypothetical p
MTTPLSPLKRALRNSGILTLLVGALTQYQGSDLQETLTAMLFTLVVITPALWLSYRWTQKLFKSPPDDPK